MSDTQGHQSQSGTDADTTQVYDPMALQMNLARVDQIRSTMGIAVGFVAGTLGLTGLSGMCKCEQNRFSVFLTRNSVVCFFILHSFVLVCVWAMKMNFRLSEFSKQSSFSYLSSAFLHSLLSFS